MDIDLVVFDLAGTTVKDNDDVPRVLQQALMDFDVDITLEEARAVMGIPKPVAIRSMLAARQKGAGDIGDSLVNAIHQGFVEAMIRFYERDHSVGEKDGASEVFRALKAANVKIVVDTGFDRPITDALLKRLRWVEENLIDGSVTSDEVLHGRPHPDMIFRAMELANVTDIARVAKVGDTASDMQEGTAAGCRYVIGITTGAYTQKDLALHPHTHLVKTLHEALNIVVGNK